MKRLLIAASIMLIAYSAHANDAASEASAGGLKLRKEHSVLMEKERLFISKELVRVEYEFRNTTKETVISEVAFPIPPLEYTEIEYHGSRDFSDFKAWVDDKPIQIETEVRAFVKKREITNELREAGLSIKEFGGFNPDQNDNVIMALEPTVRNKLVRLGALKAPDKKDSSLDYWPEWSNHIKYHWRQEFPPGVIVRIKHEYRPVAGFSQIQVQKFKKQFKDSCINSSTYNEVRSRVEKKMQKEPGNNNFFSALWVSYILSTANTWQTPIKDFELIIEGEKDDLISFCWDWPFEKIGDAKFRAYKSDFVPKKDLKIYFLDNF